MLRAGAQAHASMISSVREQLQASVVSKGCAGEDEEEEEEVEGRKKQLTVLAEDPDLLTGAILQTPHNPPPPLDTPLTRMLPALEEDAPLPSPTKVAEADAKARAEPEHALSPAPPESAVGAAGPSPAPAAGMFPPPSRKRPRPTHFTFDSVA